MKYILTLVLFLTIIINGQNKFIKIDELFGNNDITPPTAPVIYALSTPGDIGITSDTQTDCARMILYRGTTNDTSAMSIIDSAFTTSITKTDSPLTYNTNYYYSAKGVDASGNRSYFASVVFDTVRAVKFAPDFDGSTESLSLSSGTSVFDLNGAERVLKDSNSTFESGDTTDWATNGTHSIDTSGTQKYAGSYSGKVISGALGDTTTNYVSLSHTQFTPLVVGEKYTIEYFGTGVGSLGSSIISGWNFTSAWAIANGSVIDADSFTTSLSGYGVQKAVLTSGLAYQVYLAGTTSSASGLKVVNNSGGTTPLVCETTTSGNFIISGVFNTSGVAPTMIYLRNTAAGNTRIDSFTIKPITKPTATAKIGSKSWTSDTLSIIPGVFEKVVYNFQATSAEINTPIKMYLSQADTVYMDNFSITQAKDALFSYWYKGTDNGGGVISKGLAASGNVNGWEMIHNTDYSFHVGDGTTYKYTFKTTGIFDNVWHLVSVKVDRTDDIKKYTDGVLTDSSAVITGIGKISNASDFLLGKRGSSFLTGQIGETQITTFDDIATETTWTPSALYYRTNKNAQGLNFPTSYTGGTVVFWNEWTGANITAILTSKDSYNHVMTGTNMIQSDFIEVDY